MKRKDQPAELPPLGPNTPDPEGRDLFDPEYAPANERTPEAVADGAKIDARSGKLIWKWRKA